MLSNENIARIAHAAEGGDWDAASDGDRGKMVEYVHELRTEARESDGEKFDVVAGVCLAVTGEANAKLQGVLDHQALEVRSAALNAAIGFFKGAPDETQRGARDVVAAAATFERFLTDGENAGE